MQRGRLKELRKFLREQLRQQMQFCELPPPPQPSPALKAQEREQMCGGNGGFKRPFRFENHVFRRPLP